MTPNDELKATVVIFGYEFYDVDLITLTESQNSQEQKIRTLFCAVNPDFLRKVADTILQELACHTSQKKFFFRK